MNCIVPKSTSAPEATSTDFEKITESFNNPKTFQVPGVTPLILFTPELIESNFADAGSQTWKITLFSGESEVNFTEPAVFT